MTFRKRQDPIKAPTKKEDKAREKAQEIQIAYIKDHIEQRSNGPSGERLKDMLKILRDKKKYNEQKIQDCKKELPKLSQSVVDVDLMRHCLDSSDYVVALRIQEKIDVYKEYLEAKIDEIIDSLGKRQDDLSEEQRVVLFGILPDPTEYGQKGHKLLLNLTPEEQLKLPSLDAQLGKLNSKYRHLDMLKQYAELITLSDYDNSSRFRVKEGEEGPLVIQIRKLQSSASAEDKVNLAELKLAAAEADLAAAEADLDVAAAKVDLTALANDYQATGKLISKDQLNQLIQREKAQANKDLAEAELQLLLLPNEDKSEDGSTAAKKVKLAVIEISLVNQRGRLAIANLDIVENQNFDWQAVKYGLEQREAARQEIEKLEAAKAAVLVKLGSTPEKEVSEVKEASGATRRELASQHKTELALQFFAHHMGAQVKLDIQAKRSFNLFGAKGADFIKEMESLLSLTSARSEVSLASPLSSPKGSP